MRQRRVRSGELSKFVTTLLLTNGVPRVQAETVARQLISASLRGTDTHGVALVERYLNGIRDGKINTNPRIRVVRDGAGTALIDGDHGLGQYVATKATEMAIKKAERCGIGAAAAIRISHCGMLAYYGMLIARRKMAAIVFTNSSALAAPWGASSRVFGTNPICYAFPYENHPIVFDAATTVVAGMKVVLAERQGKRIPLGWAIDERGRPTTSPQAALRGSLLPFGEYKGYALMLMSELYSAAISGGQLSFDISSRRDAQGGFYVQALDPEAMGGYGNYAKRVRRLMKAIKSAKLAKGHPAVYLPGELESITERKRLVEGVPVDEPTWQFFRKVSAELKVELPSLA